MDGPPRTPWILVAIAGGCLSTAFVAFVGLGARLKRRKEFPLALWEWLRHLGVLVPLTVWTTLVCIHIRYHGLGAAGPPQHVPTFSKYEYVEELLFLSTLAMVKMISGRSAAFVFGVARPLERRTAVAITAMTLSAMVALILGCLLQCGSELAVIRGQPDRRCFDRSSFWTAAGVLDGMTDLLLSGCLLYPYFRAQISNEKKTRLMVFCALYFPIFIGVVSLRVVLERWSWQGTDYSELAGWTALCTVCQLGLITACQPSSITAFKEALPSYLDPAIAPQPRNHSLSTTHGYLTRVSAPNTSARAANSDEDLMLDDYGSGNGKIVVHKAFSVKSENNMVEREAAERI